jgi:hypothetical protein
LIKRRGASRAQQKKTDASRIGFFSPSFHIPQCETISCAAELLLRGTNRDISA